MKSKLQIILFLSLLPAVVLVSCTTLGTMPVAGDTPEPDSGYVLIRMDRESSSVSGTLLLAGRGKDYRFSFNTVGLKLFAVVPGSYRITEVNVEGTSVDVRSDELNRSIEIEAGEVMYLGDWEIYQQSMFVGYRSVRNFSQRAFSELEAERPMFARLDRENLFFGEDEIVVEDLSADEFAIRIVRPIEPAYDVLPFFQAYDAMIVLSTFNLDSVLPEPLQIRLMDEFFAAMPEEPTGNAYTVSEAFVGGWMDDGSPLELQLRVATINPDVARDGTVYVVVVASNAETDPSSGEPIRTPIPERTGFPGFSAFETNGHSLIFVLYENGRLVSSSVYAESENTEMAYAVARVQPFAAVNLIDTFIRDGDVENDTLIPALFESLDQQEELELPVAATARLNRLMYAVFEGRLDDAEEIRGSIAGDFPELDEPSFLHAVEVEAPIVIKLAEAATGMAED